MRISEIVPYDKKRDKVLMDEGLVLLFYKSEMRSLGLREGMELTDEDYRGKLLPVLVKRAKERVIYLLKDTDRSERDVRRKLRESLYPEEAADRAVAWALQNRYLDDERYAENYLRYHSEGRSRRRLAWDLANKGISRDIIERLLEDEELDEAAAVRKELAKRHFDPETADDAERRRVSAALMRKGFSWEQIRTAMSLED